MRGLYYIFDILMIDPNRSARLEISLQNHRNLRIPCGRDRRTRIVKAELGNRAGIIGAALLGKNKRI